MNEMIKRVKRNGPGDMEGRGKVDEKKEKERKKGKEEKGRARKWRKEARW